MNSVRQPLIAANWKMNGLRADGTALAGAVAARAKAAGAAFAADVLVCPPATLVALVGEALAGSPVRLGGQDCSPEASGAFTGDIAAAMLADLGCGAVIVGHSERRAGYGETDAQVRAKARREHYPAPYAIIDLWTRYGARGAAAYEAEARSIANLMVGQTSRNLVRVFFLQERMKALGGKSKFPMQRVHVVGAGVMGGDIAAWCAQRGLNVTLQDRELKFIQPALQRARESFEKRLKDSGKAAELMTRMTADVAGDGVPGADIIIEAIFENADAKHELFARTEPRMKAGAILTSNTSSIMLEQLDDNLPDPGRLVGVHFFNPVSQLPLVEIVHGEQSSEEAVQKAIAFTRKIDKLPLPCKSSPGFLVNRVLVPYLYEAMFALQDGIAIETIDEAALRYGMPVGPVELADVVGLDVCKHVGDIVSAALNKQKPDTSRIDALIAAKKLGRKSGEGFYVWRDGKAVKSKAPLAEPPADLEDRLILALANECAAVLREGIVADAATQAPLRRDDHPLSGAKRGP